MLVDWDDAWPVAREIIARAPRGTLVSDLIPEICARTGYPITTEKLNKACNAREGCCPRSLMGSERSQERYAVPPPPPTDPVGPSAATTPNQPPHLAAIDGGQKDFDDLMRLCKRGVPFGELCDKLDMSPRRVRALIGEAQAEGYQVDVAGDVVAQREPEPEDDAQDVGVAPVVGGRYTVAVISDTHFGSKYCMREQLVDFLHAAYDRGCRHVLHAGDMLDGCYKHGMWELSHHGVDDQISDALETLPRLEGMHYHYTAGNHDQTFTNSTGLDTGRLIEDRARAEGRTDLHYHGARGALLKFGTVKVELWHPRSGKAYALSYKLQNFLRDMPAATGRKPDIIVAGHWHTFCYFEQRGVHAIAAPCWQGGGSSFGKSLGGAPSIGGLIVSWDLTAHGTLRNVAVERSSYYEVEHYREIAA